MFFAFSETSSQDSVIQNRIIEGAHTRTIQDATPLEVEVFGAPVPGSEEETIQLIQNILGKNNEKVRSLIETTIQMVCLIFLTLSTTMTKNHC